MKRVFVVWEPALGQGFEDGRSITADGPLHAAEQWADWSDYASNEYHIVKGQPATVLVREATGGPTRAMIVSGESIRRYAARLQIKEDAS